jgi:polysaccharide biosynthesis protein PslH
MRASTRARTDGPPKVLFLTGHLPYPAISGGRLREFELLRRLAMDYEIHLRVVSKTYPEDSVNRGLLLDYCASVEVYAAEAGRAECAQVAAHRSRGLRKSVVRALAHARCDLIHSESFYMAQHVPAACRVPLLIVAQNVEHLLWRQRWEKEHDRVRAREHYLEWCRTQDAEVRAWRRADLCAAVSEEDRLEIEGLLGAPGVRLVPCGWDHVSQNGSRPLRVNVGGDPFLVFVGNFAYGPSADGAEFLCDEILARVVEKLPGTRLALVGNDPTGRASRLASDRVLVTGRVPDVAPWLKAADLIVSPLRVGGGMKMKVLEALALGKPLVTTSIGVQGLGADARRAIRVRDGAGSFAAEVVALAKDRAARASLGRAARAFVGELPTWDDAAAALSQCYSELLAEPAALREDAFERSPRRMPSPDSRTDVTPPVRMPQTQPA